MLQLVHVRNTKVVQGLEHLVTARVELFSLAKSSLTRRNPSAVFHSLCLPFIPSTCLLVIFLEICKIKKGFLNHLLHVTCILLLSILHLELQSRGLDTEF